MDLSATRFGVGFLFFGVPGVVVALLLDSGQRSEIPLGSGGEKRVFGRELLP